MKKIRKPLSCLLSFLMLLSVLSVLSTVTAGAKLVYNEGYCGRNGGTNLSYRLDGDGVLTISGTGEMMREPPFQYDDRIKKVVIEPGATSIGYYAFKGCSNLETVEIPNTVNKIDVRAFYQSGLQSVSIPSSVTSLELGVFENCSRLSSVELPSVMTEIGNATFSGCTSLSQIVFPSSLTKIGSTAFSSTGLTSIDLPEGVTEVGGGAFSNTELTEVNLPESLKTISDTMFYQTKIKDIVIPDHITEIGDWAFANDRVPLETITIGSSVKTIGEYCFCNVNEDEGHAVITEINIPDSVEVIKKNAFYIPSITSVHAGKGLQEFKNAFYMDKNISEFTIDSENPYLHSFDNVIYNSDYTDFMWLNKKRTGLITFPKELKKISKNYTFSTEALGFSECAIEEGAENFTAVDGVLYTKDVSNLYYCPDKRDKKLVVPSTVTEINDYACACVNCEIDFSACENLTTIGRKAFWYGGKGALTLPEGPEEVGYNAFAYSRFTSAVLPDSLLKINMLDFSASDLQTVYIGSGTQLVESNTSASSTGYFGSKTVSVTVSPDNPYMASSDGAVFTKDLSKVTYIPSGKTSLRLPKETSRFYLHPNRNLDITVDPENPYLCSEDCFLMSKDKTVLYRVKDKYSNLTVPSSVKSLGYIADRPSAPFNYLTRLRTLTFPEGFCSFAEQSIYGSVNHCNVTVINIPSTVKEVRGIIDCEYLTTINMAEGVESFNGNQDLDSLKQLNLPKSCKYVYLPRVSGTLSKLTVPNSNCVVGNVGYLDSTSSVTAYCGSPAHRAAVIRKSKFTSLGHVWLDWYTKTPATYTESGVEFRDCAFCDDHEERTVPMLKKDTNTATFMADGKIVSVVEFYDTMTEIEEPPVPEKDRYLGEWEDYTLGDEDIVINAVYTLVKSEDAEDIKTESEAELYYETDDVLFNIKASSAAKTVKSTISQSVPLDIVLVADQSGSMDETLGGSKKKVDALKEAAADFVERVSLNAKQTGAGHRIAIAGFGLAGTYQGYSKNENTELLTNATGQPVVYHELTPALYSGALLPVLSEGRTNPALTDAVNSIEARGATAADLGLEMAKSIYANTDSAGRQRVVVFMTDGEPTYGSRFQTTVAKSAIANARVLKETYGASVYSLGVFEDSLLSDQNIVTFMKAVSSDYPEASSMTNLGARRSEHFFTTVNHTDSLSGVFKTITTESLSHTAAFDKLTLIKTLSQNVTLTDRQEQELRVSLKRNYALSDDDIHITRKENGTTEIKINNLSPKKVEGENGEVTYEVSVSFFASLNENAVTAGEIAVDTEDSGVMLGDDSNGYEATFAQSTVTLDQDKKRFIFTVNNLVYDITEGDSPSDAVPSTDFPTDWAFSGWNTAGASDENGTVINATLIKANRTVTWHTADGETIQTYVEGDIIIQPEVQDKEDGSKFLSWNKSIPTVMPDENLEFTAVYGDHVHKYVSETVKPVGCEEDGIVRYSCSCGDSYTETVPHTGHHFESVTSSTENDSSKCTFVCSNCGLRYEYALNYEITAKSGWFYSKYEFSLIDDDLETGFEPDGRINIRIPLSELQGNVRSAYVTRMQDGRKVMVDSEIKDGYLIIKADHFSPYEINFVDQNSDIFTGHSLTLSGDIGVNYFIALPEGCGAADSEIEFSFNQRKVSVPVSDFRYDSKSGCYIIPCKVASKEMTDPILAVLKCNGEIIAAEEYSVEQYARRIIENKDGEFNDLFPDEPGKLERLQNLVRSMLIYGAKSQYEFNYNTGRLADSSLGEYVLEPVNAADLSSYTYQDSDFAEYGLKFEGSKLRLKSKTSYILYFSKTDENAEMPEVKAADGKTITPYTDQGFYCYEIENIPAKEITDDIALLFNGSQKVFNTGSYISRALNSGDSKLIAVVTALYAYNQAARAYFI